jgi:anthranilate synthase/aminodeoxychorismate synthase-like glutamine amidotransferase
MKGTPPSHVEIGVTVLLLDNRDSFTFNLAQAFMELGVDVCVEEALHVTAASVKQRRPRLVCIGPGPRGPRELPQLVELVRALDGEVPLFGVCLGLQVLVRARGGDVGRAAVPVHGKRDAVTHDGQGAFRGLPSPLWVMRYHSLVARTLPSSLAATAVDSAGQVMAVRDERARIEAVQFHPESIGTAGGLALLANVLRGVGISVTPPAARPGAIPDATDQGPGFADSLYNPQRVPPQTPVSSAAPIES